MAELEGPPGIDDGLVSFGKGDGTTVLEFEAIYDLMSRRIFSTPLRRSSMLSIFRSLGELDTSYVGVLELREARHTIDQKSKLGASTRSAFVRRRWSDRLSWSCGSLRMGSVCRSGSMILSTVRLDLVDIVLYRT